MTEYNWKVTTTYYPSRTVVYGRRCFTTTYIDVFADRDAAMAHYREQALQFRGCAPGSNGRRGGVRVAWRGHTTEPVGSTTRRFR